MKEKELAKFNGFLGLLIILLCVIVSLYVTLVIGTPIACGFTIGLMLVILFFTTGMTIVQPNQARVFTFFGKYMGVIKQEGIWFTIPLCVQKAVSLKVINFSSDKIKVNDAEGNPVEVAVVCVYKVTDSAMALFNVEDYKEFVRTQSETTLRHIVSLYPYDNFNNEKEVTLRKNSDEIGDELTKDLQNRLSVAGVEIIEARIMHLAYSSEIASAMLQRQQAQAVLSARKVIVEGAVSMVKSAIEQLSNEGIVELDEEKKAQMVNNLMVSIISEKGTQPIVNTGTVY